MLNGLLIMGHAQRRVSPNAIAQSDGKTQMADGWWGLQSISVEVSLEQEKKPDIPRPMGDITSPFTEFGAEG